MRPDSSGKFNKKAIKFRRVGLMEIQKINVNKDNISALKCPHCGTASTVNVAKFNNRRGPLKVRCKCGSAFRVLFEVRKAYRKETRLHGSYFKHSAGEEQGMIIVRNISLSGIGLTTLIKHNLKNGVVRVVNDKSIGCQFRAPDQRDRALGFYLMPEPVGTMN